MHHLATIRMLQTTDRWAQHCSMLVWLAKNEA